MIVSVVSPVHGQAGNTTAAILLGEMIARTQGVSVCLTHLKPQSSSFYDYLGLDGREDKTCMPTQVVNLMRSGIIKKEQIRDYCISVSDNYDIFSNNSKSMLKEDMTVILEFMMNHVPHDILIVDVDEGVSNDMYLKILRKSDMCIVTLSQSNNVINRYENVFLPFIRERVRTDNFRALCNQYDPLIGSVKQFENHAGVKGCMFLHHSPYIAKLGNDGRLNSLVDIVLQKDMRVIELLGDMSGIVKKVMVMGGFGYKDIRAFELR